MEHNKASIKDLAKSGTHHSSPLDTRWYHNISHGISSVHLATDRASQRFVLSFFGQMSKQKQTDYFYMLYMATVISTQT